LAAVMIPEEMYQAMLAESRKLGVFGHGFTYSGHPVAAAVAVKTLEIYARDRVVERAARLAPYFQGKLKAMGNHPLIGEARGMGLIGGLEIVRDKHSGQPFEGKHGVGPRAMAFAEEE